jgi:hypothetical protein
LLCFENCRGPRAQIRGGELVLDPWPTAIRDIKFATPKNSGSPEVGAELRPQVGELFQYVREVDDGEIRCLEIRRGIPFAMEVELSGAEGGRRG